MAACERCWARSFASARANNEEQSEAYRRLVRTSDCTPEQQAGPDATRCPKCDTRTVHQHTHQCIACGYDAATLPPSKDSPLPQPPGK